MLTQLASLVDATSYGFDCSQVTDLALMKASAFIHAEAGPGLVATATAKTVVGRGPLIALPLPVVSVTTVTDEDGTVLSAADDDYELVPGGWVRILVASNATELFTIVYQKGAVPDGVVFLACQIAARLTATPSGLSAGAQQEGAGPFQVTYGWDAWKGQTGLTAGERAALRRLLPARPKLIVMRQS